MKIIITDEEMRTILSNYLGVEVSLVMENEDVGFTIMTSK